MVPYQPGQTGLQGNGGQIGDMYPLLQLSGNLNKTSVWHFLAISTGKPGPEAQGSSLVLETANREPSGIK